MRVGDVIEAKATLIVQYGIWLEADGKRGLLLIPDLSYRRIRHPSEIAKAGDSLRVQVVALDGPNYDFAATRKHLYPEESSG